MVGMTDKDAKRFNNVQKDIAKKITAHRHDLLAAYFTKFASMTEWPADEIELREFRKSELEVSFRFVPKRTTDEQIVATIGDTVRSTALTCDQKIEKLAAVLGVTDYD